MSNDATRPVQPYADPPAASGHTFGLHHVQLCLPAGGEGAARAFYVDQLGMTEVQKPPVLAARGGLWVRADALEIHLGVEADFRPAAKAHPGIVVGDIDAFAAHAESVGLEPDWDDNFPGMRRFYLHDPFGNRLEFLCPQPAPQGQPHPA